MSSKHWVTKLAHPNKIAIHRVVDWEHQYVVRMLRNLILHLLTIGAG
ncbi:hypothetical protein Hanom_Chr08g00686021 [Helianthus anomalus]